VTCWPRGAAVASGRLFDMYSWLTHIPPELSLPCQYGVPAASQPSPKYAM
jgi:hypothetical protein